MNQLEQNIPVESRQQEALRVATQMFSAQPDWVTFFREVLGTEGVIRRLFPTDNEIREFESTPEYVEIQKMLAQLRFKEEQTAVPDDRIGGDKEPTRVITVRLPKSLHESLRAEAHQRQTSMNKLCIAKLLQMIREELVSQQDQARQT